MTLFHHNHPDVYVSNAYEEEEGEQDDASDASCIDGTVEESRREGNSIAG